MSLSAWEAWSLSPQHRDDALHASPTVLYADAKGHWVRLRFPCYKEPTTSILRERPMHVLQAPLQCMYWSTDSHCLVSRHPESSREEVEYYYCSQVGLRRVPRVEI